MLIQWEYPHKKIKNAVLDALEGWPKWATEVAETDKKGRARHDCPFKILVVL